MTNAKLHSLFLDIKVKMLVEYYTFCGRNAPSRIKPDVGDAQFTMLISLCEQRRINNKERKKERQLTIKTMS